jgi:hypothetical protein
VCVVCCPNEVLTCFLASPFCSDVSSILFIDNLAGYNQVMFEDVNKNRMHESLELFNKVTYMPLFKDTPMFLFLNKRDLFERSVSCSSF